jgi:hypothetical protein
MNKCLNCGNPVKNKFCNTSCLNKYYTGKRTYNKEKYEKYTIKKLGVLKEYKVICEICKKEFIVCEREKTHPKKEKYYCSRSCANTRIMSEITIQKIKQALRKDTEYKWKEYHIKICKECNKEFKTIKKKQNFCSRRCARKHNGKVSGEKIKNNKNFSESVSNGRKKAFKNGTLQITGGTTKWFEYKNIKVQGTYELRTCFILDKWKEIGKIKDWQYTNDRIGYIDLNNKKHTYLLDFKVFENDNSFYYIETKGYKKDNDELKWKAVRDKGYKLIVWFNEDIKRNECSLTC